MKVCKKCKKHVANKTRICKFCGADVSKARVVKNNNVRVKQQNIKQNNNIELKKQDTNSKKVSNNEVKNIVVLNEKKVSKEVFVDKKIEKKFVIILDKLKCIINNIRNLFVKLCTYLKTIRFINNRFSLKVFAIVFLILITVGTFSYFGVDAYMDREVVKEEVVVGEKATTDKIFSMGDLIIYDGVDYKVTKVQTSKGNYYKTPKEGYEFVIVTVYIKNNTSDKIAYSYDNWTMSNSLNEEKTVLFTSINTNDALYSGELVIGGIKIGSMVFEQPINDSKLRLNFYDLKKNENGEDVTDYSKKEFSVSVKIPEDETTNEE